MKNYLKSTFYILFVGVTYVLTSIACSSREKDPTAAPETVPTFVEKHGRLQVSGTALLNQHGQSVVLRGVSLGWHNWWPRFYDKETIAWLCEDWNISLVRAAIGVGPEGSYMDKPEFAFERLYEVIDASIEEGIYVIIDWHSHEIYTEDAKDFFMQVATKYKDYPNVIYELYNEPVDDTWQEVKAYAEELIGAIRRIDPHAVILVGNPHWDQDIHLVADDPIQGHDNIMYTVHFYAGSHDQDLRDRADYALQKNIPVFISECAGMEATGDGAIDHAEWERWREWMEEKQLSWAAWSIADKNESCSMIRDQQAPIASWEDEDLKEWGKIVRKTIRSSNQ